MVVLANPVQSLEKVRHVGTERPSVCMQLVDDDVFQIGENKIESEVAVVRQKSRVEHVRVGENDVCATADFASFVDGRVAVVNAGLDFVFPKIFEEWNQIAELVARQRFCRIDEYRAGFRVVQDFLHDRKQEAQRFSACG